MATRNIDKIVYELEIYEDRLRRQQNIHPFRWRDRVLSEGRDQSDLF